MEVFSTRRIMAIIAAASTIALGLSACSSGNTSDTSSSESKNATITVWADADHTAALKDVASSFTKSTGINVKVIQKDLGSVQKDLITQVPAGQGPDIAIGPNDWTGLLATDGVIQPIDLGDAQSDFEKVSIDAFNYQGKIYALPYSIENVALVRNTKLAPNAPTSWDDMVNTAKQANAKYPYLLQIGDQGDAYTMYPVQTSFGSSVFAQNSDGSYDAKNLTIGNEQGKAFASWLSEQAKEGILSTSITADIALSKFEAGESPYIITGPWNIPALKKAGLNVAVSAIPSAGGQPAKPFVGVNGFFLSSQTKNKIAATNFLTNYVGTEKVQEALYKAGGLPPALSSAFEKVAEDDFIKGFEEAGKTGVPMPNVTEMSAVWQSWNNAEVSIVNQQGDPTQIWDNMSGEIQKTINK